MHLFCIHAASNHLSLHAIARFFPVLTSRYAHLVSTHPHVCLPACQLTTSPASQFTFLLAGSFCSAEQLNHPATGSFRIPQLGMLPSVNQSCHRSTGNLVSSPIRLYLRLCLLEFEDQAGVLPTDRLNLFSDWRHLNPLQGNCEE